MMNHGHNWIVGNGSRLSTLLLSLLFSVTNHFVSPLAFAQQSVTTATVSGRVEDTAGACVCGAMVAITNTDTKRKQITVTDQEGRYRISHLPVGNYQMAVECPGFNPLNQQVMLTVGQALDLAGKNRFCITTPRMKSIIAAPTTSPTRRHGRSATRTQAATTPATADPTRTDPDQTTRADLGIRNTE